ncbi:MAG: ABC transporter permease subunit [Myxococcota bacterium]|nr:ABC transporter permease subunit [Myxococcota bacterium]
MSKDQSRIYHIGYRPLARTGRPLSPIWPIAENFIKTRWGNRATKLMLLVAGGVFFLHMSWLFIQLFGQKLGGTPAAMAGGIQAADIVGRTQDVLVRFLSTQFYVAALMAGVIGGGVIADERRIGALSVYFSRPVTRVQFIAGKVGAVLSIPVAVYVLPTLILWIFALGLCQPSARLGLLASGPSALLVSTLGALLIATTVTALSATAIRARTASILYAGALITLTGIAESSVSVGQSWVGYVSPERLLRTLVMASQSSGTPLINEVLGPIKVNPSATLSAVALAAFILGSVAFLVHALSGEQGK